MTKIEFGTDGWRAVLDKDFTQENTKKVIDGISHYIWEKSKYNKKIIIKLKIMMIINCGKVKLSSELLVTINYYLETKNLQIK